MRRRDFLGGASAAFAFQLPPPGEVFIERPQPGKPHAGKVLAAIQPHADDIPLFAAGLVLKLIDEGYTGYLIRTTNDDMTGPGGIGEGVLANERDNQAVARGLGLKQVFDLNYGNHQMDGISKPELRCRLIFLFRLLRVDTVICFDPWCPYEENPDHYVTAQCVEAACWMAGMSKDYPEHFAAGLQPHAVRERYYYARGPQLVNRIVDISAVIDRKVEVNLLNRAQGPAGDTGARLRRSLAEKGLRLPLLGEDDLTASRRYIKEFVLARNRELGQRYGLEYAEAYHYIGPPPDAVDDYVRRHAVPLRR
jgi:LmbE family N-acetylglucosaminyl deacetylase